MSLYTDEELFDALSAVWEHLYQSHTVEDGVHGEWIEFNNGDESYRLSYIRCHCYRFPTIREFELTIFDPYEDEDENVIDWKRVCWVGWYRDHTEVKPRHLSCNSTGHLRAEIDNPDEHILSVKMMTMPSAMLPQNTLLKKQ